MIKLTDAEAVLLENQVVIMEALQSMVHNSSTDQKYRVSSALATEIAQSKKVLEAWMKPRISRHPGKTMDEL